MEKHTEELIASFRALDTSCISDALDSLHMSLSLPLIHAAAKGMKLCGVAYTVRYIPCEVQEYPSRSYLEEVCEGEVIVIDNSGRMDCSVWGDLMSLAAKHKRVEGTLIDGACRDIAALEDFGYPVFAKGCSPASGKNRVRIGETGGPVSISGRIVRAGDIIIADDSGAVAVPRQQAEEVLETAQKINNAENRILTLLHSGEGFDQAVKLSGSHPHI